MVEKNIINRGVISRKPSSPPDTSITNQLRMTLPEFFGINFQFPRTAVQTAYLRPSQKTTLSPETQPHILPDQASGVSRSAHLVSQIFVYTNFLPEKERIRKENPGYQDQTIRQVAGSQLPRLILPFAYGPRSLPRIIIPPFQLPFVSEINSPPS